MLFLRFHMIDKPHLWVSLREGYEEAVGIPLKPHRQCDLCAMTTALIPMSRSDVPRRESVTIIRGLLEGTLVPLVD